MTCSGWGLTEVAATIKRDAAACRQLAARARNHVREERPRFQLEKQRGLELAKAFFTASRSGDMSALGAMLAADVSVHADGGGKRSASPASDLRLRRGDEAPRLSGGSSGRIGRHSSARASSMACRAS